MCAAAPSQLAKAHPGQTLVPTLDVDLIWHVHMLSPLDYREDCHALLGRELRRLSAARGPAGRVNCVACSMSRTCDTQCIAQDNIVPQR